MRATVWIALATVTVISTVVSTACHSQPGKERGARRRVDSAAGDSAYWVVLRKWLRDSAVLDSMTRQVKTDNLYQLYRQALSRSGVTLDLMSAVACEELRLGIRYGAVPSDRAINAMLDTVYRDIGVKDALDYFATRAPSEGKIETGLSQCQPIPPAAPRLIGNTRLDTELPGKPRP